MKYMGSKARIAKHILPIMLKDREHDNQYFVEPFVGGANIIEHVTGKRIGADTNRYLVAMLKAASLGWLPPKNFTEDQYKELRLNKEKFPEELVGYVGFALSYGGKFFGGWCRDSAGNRNYVDEAYRNAVKQFPKLEGVEFVNCQYHELEIPTNSIVYCDPPYKNTTSYSSDIFDYNHFYNYCRGLKILGHSVYVSEYDMPDDFTIVWEKEISSSLTADTGSKKATEKLFTLL